MNVKNMRRIGFLLGSMSLSLCACDPHADAPPPATQNPTSAAITPTAPGHAAVGSQAPDFALPDLDGRVVHLSDYRGKVVVLEWFNPGCPFVRASHMKGSLKGTAKRLTDKGVVWLAINSASAGKEGYGADATKEGKRAYGMEHAVLLDPSGEVGHRYGATNTPHMFVVDASGMLRYRGAIDNSPDGDGESPTGGKLVNYVDATIDAINAQQPVAVTETAAYGCSVKY